MGKWSWRFAKERGPLWKRVIIGKYGLQEGAWCTKEVRERFGAGLWKAIRNSWGVFKVKTRLQVGARTRVKFWEDRWCGETLLRDVFLGPNSTASSKDAWVVDVWDGGSWDPRFIRQFNDWEMEDVNRFFRRLHNYIASGTIDDMVWLGTKNGVFSV